MTAGREHVPDPLPPVRPDTPERVAIEIRAEIGRLQLLSSRGLWALSLFLLVSLLAWLNFPLLPAPAVFIAHLGRPPSGPLISTVLLIYVFFAIILSLGRMMTGAEHRSSFCHVGYLTAFYFFYYAAGALNDNYWAVFCSGVTILGVESYRIRTFCLEAIARQTERLTFFERTGRLPPDD